MRKAQSRINKQGGFSVVEVLLAASIFALIVTALLGVYLYGQESTALAGSRARASMLAEEGLEAVESIRDAGFVNLVDGTYGLATTSNYWNLSGTSNTIDIFTRQIAISAIDDKRKHVTSTVTWQQNNQRTGIVQLVTRFTNWLASGLVPNHILIYGDGTTAPKFRTYDTSLNTFSAESSTVSSASGRSFIVRVSPTSSEAVAGLFTSTGELRVFCYDGADWTEEWTATVGGPVASRPFNIAYETDSGDVMVLYGSAATTTNELAYRTKLGTTGCGSGNWSGVNSLNPVRTSGLIHWVRMAWDRRAGQNLIAAVWADANRDLSAMIWNGATWGNEPTAATETSLEIVSLAQDIEDFDIEYESLSGDVMVVWANSAGANGTNGVRYRTCTGGTSACTWNAVTTPPTFSDDATNLDISANPNTDEIVFASIGNAGSDLQFGRWSGSAWANTANADTSCSTPVAASKHVATGWVVDGGTTRSVVVYGDNNSNAINWYLGNGGTFTPQADITISPGGSNLRRTQFVEMNPVNKNQLMYLFSDSNNDLFAKRLVLTAPATFTWTNSDGAALETTLPQAVNNPFWFSFSRF
ncbi:MAG: hypothetical protein AAB691_04150 [Patescibacteria group bacterium]